MRQPGHTVLELQLKTLPYVRCTPQRSRRAPSSSVHGVLNAAAHLWWFEGVVMREVDVQEEHSALIRGSCMQQEVTAVTQHTSYSLLQRQFVSKATMYTCSEDEMRQEDAWGGPRTEQQRVVHEQ